MRIIIVGSSPVKTFFKKYQLNPSDYFIGVDGGALELLKKDIKPDLAIGDFDSTNDFEKVKKEAYEVKCYNPCKDETDLELAFKALENLKGATNLEIDVYDAIGGRLDHEFNAYLLLAKYKQYKIHLLDDKNEVLCLNKGQAVYLKKASCQYFSVFALESAVININNSLYNLENRLLKLFDTYAISNEPLNDHTRAIIEVKEGSIIVFINYK